MVHDISMLSIQHFGEKHGGEIYTVLPDGLSPTVTFTACTAVLGPKANEMEMGTALFTENGAGRNLKLFYIFPLNVVKSELYRFYEMMRCWCSFESVIISLKISIDCMPAKSLNFKLHSIFNF